MGRSGGTGDVGVLLEAGAVPGEGDASSDGDARSDARSVVDADFALSAGDEGGGGSGEVGFSAVLDTTRVKDRPVGGGFAGVRDGTLACDGRGWAVG